MAQPWLVAAPSLVIGCSLIAMFILFFICLCYFVIPLLESSGSQAEVPKRTTLFVFGNRHCREERQMQGYGRAYTKLHTDLCKPCKEGNVGKQQEP